MFPVLFRIGSFELRTFGVLMVMAFLVGIGLATQRAERFGLKKSQISDVAIWVILFGILGARITYIGLHWSFYSQNMDQLLSLKFDGLTSFGGIVGGILALVFFSKRAKVPLVAFLDCISLPVLVAHAVGRVGCLLNGCCYGYACETSPPGVSIQGLPGYYLPAQLYDTVMVLVGAGIQWAIEKKPLGRGGPLGWTLVIYGVSRFIYEYWRIGASSEKFLNSPLSLAQFASIVMVLAGLWFVVRGYRNKTISILDSKLVS